MISLAHWLLFEVFGFPWGRFYRAPSISSSFYVFGSSRLRWVLRLICGGLSATSSPVIKSRAFLVGRGLRRGMAGVEPVGGIPVQGSGVLEKNFSNKEGDVPKPSTWAEKVVGSRSLKRKMLLVYHEPEPAEEMVMVVPPQEVVEEGAKEWELCLVGYLMDPKFPPAIVASIARKMWTRFGLADACVQGNGIFFFKFSIEEGKDRVLEGGPWLFARRHLLLRRWERGIKFLGEGISKIFVWIQLYNVPVEL